MQNVGLTPEEVAALGAARLAEAGHPAEATAPSAPPAVDAPTHDSQEQRDGMTGGRSARSPLEVERSIQSEAEATARMLAKAGYPADFDVASLAGLDDLIGNSWTDGRPTPGGIFAPPYVGPGSSPDLQAAKLGVYVGETLLRRHGGQWRVAQPGERWALCKVLQLPNGLSTNPIWAVGRRMGAGPTVSEYASSVAALAEGRALDGESADYCPDRPWPTRSNKIGTTDVMHVVETFAGTAAGWLREKGLPADCGPASLACLDQFITDNAPEWGPMWEGDLRPEDVPQHSPMLRRVFALGCYIGKSLRRKHGGKWHWPDDPLFLELEFPNGSSVAPVWAVSMRLQYGWSVASFVHAAAVFAGGQGNDNRANDRSS